MIAGGGRRESYSSGAGREIRSAVDRYSLSLAGDSREAASSAVSESHPDLGFTGVTEGSESGGADVGIPRWERSPRSGADGSEVLPIV